MKNQKTPKWYLISSIVVAVIVVPLLIISQNTLGKLAILFLLPIWALVCLYVLVYFLAKKKYAKSSLVLPIVFIVGFLVIWLIFWLFANLPILWFSFIFAVIITGISLYLLWEE